MLSHLSVYHPKAKIKLYYKTICCILQQVILADVFHVLFNFRNMSLRKRHRGLPFVAQGHLAVDCGHRCSNPERRGWESNSIESEVYTAECPVP